MEAWDFYLGEVKMLSDRQATMRQNYVNGGPGVLVSGLAWLAAAIVAHSFGSQAGMISLFVGGMLIVPISGVIEGKMRGDVSAPDKGLMRLAMFTLPLLFGGLFFGYVLSFRNELLFFVVMAIAIGLRYLVFSRIYGLNAYIILGALLIMAGVIAYLSSIRLVALPAAVGVIEVVIASFLILRERK
ncbi:MAG: hypothetical protein ABJG15_04045 [Hyphomonadaceae bacterium]